jgi:D-alanyl-lipoteichoic acid acyltransferase DltB (MBOAT superfamily)
VTSDVDAVRALLQPANDGLAVTLQDMQWPASLVGALVGLVQLAELAVLAGGTAWLCGALHRCTVVGTDGVRKRLARAIAAGATVGAVGLFGWSVRLPSPDTYALCGRWDHLLFAALAGLALSCGSVEWRAWTMALLSAYFVVVHLGVIPIAVVMTAALAGFAVTHLSLARTARATALVNGTLFVAVLLLCLKMHNLGRALKTEAVLAFVLLRHVSFVVEARRGQVASVGRYLCYILFYPSFIGASEVYREFSERNFVGSGTYDYRAAVRRFLLGQLQVWAAFQIDTSVEQVVRINSTPLLWLGALLVFVRVSLFVMGLWFSIEGAALFYGVRLRPNFAGILVAENPSQFWHSWRGTMTNWLIQYVYVPLGGNRRQQARNILAVFLVSTMWHCMGVVFMRERLHALDFVPVGLWGLLNALAVIGYLLVRPGNRRVLPTATPAVVRRAGKILLTAFLGSATVILLGFRPDTVDRFPAFMRTLFGLQ